MSNSCSTSTRLSPTLWRTCRVLANKLRLRILHQLIQYPDQTVSALARTLHMSLPLASQYLRALNARGLLQAHRTGPWLHYRPSPDRSIPAAAPLLSAIRETFATENQPIELIFRQVTAFTHPRRVIIVRHLRVDERTKESLQITTGMSGPALTRHLRKLIDRGFVVSDGGIYRCTHPQGFLAKTLLKLACEH